MGQIDGNPALDMHCGKGADQLDGVGDGVRGWVHAGYLCLFEDERTGDLTAPADGHGSAMVVCGRECDFRVCGALE